MWSAWVVGMCLMRWSVWNRYVVGFAVGLTKFYVDLSSSLDGQRKWRQMHIGAVWFSFSRRIILGQDEALLAENSSQLEAQEAQVANLKEQLQSVQGVAINNQPTKKYSQPANKQPANRQKGQPVKPPSKKQSTRQTANNNKKNSQPANKQPGYRPTKNQPTR